MSSTVIVRGEWCLTMGPQGAIRNGGVAFEQGRILDVAAFSDLTIRYPGSEIVGGDHDLVLPGLINAHTHLNEGLLPGLGSCYTLFEWADRVIYPTERVISRDQARSGALIAGLTALESGTTTVCDMFCHNNPGFDVSLASVDALEELGLRGVICFGPEDRYGNAPLASYLEEQGRLASRCRAARRIDFMLGLGTVLGVSDTYFRWLIEESRRSGLDVHTHLAEVREEITQCRQRHGLTTTELCEAHGLLDRGVLAAHCIWLTENDRILLRERGVRAVHNPVSNMRLASGVCDLRRLLADDVPTAIGADGSASNDSQNMFGVMKATLLLQRVMSLDATAIDCKRVLELATIDGARALHLQDTIGSLEAGKCADVVLLCGDRPTMVPVHDPHAHVVLVCTGSEVHTVWIDGERVVEDGRATRVDVPEELRRARAHGTQLLAAAKVRSQLLPD